MLAAFLPTYAFRGVSAPYLWWYYRLLAVWTDEPAFFITGRNSVRPVREWDGRWECERAAQARLGYRLPGLPLDPQHHYAWLDDDRFDRWLRESGGSPIEVFRRFLTRRDASFEQELRELLGSAPANLEAVVCVCNVPALDAVCAELGIPVVHVELGPLRAPHYRETGYVDFRGVNGNTEAASRYEVWHRGGRHLPVGLEDIREFAAARAGAGCMAAPEAPARDLGVVLQVEDDSNVVAFGNGIDNVALLAVARLQADDGTSLRVRPHPGSLFAVRDGDFVVDDSPDSPTFIRRCAALLTVNSSVGLEALLQAKPVQALGDCSYAFVAQAEKRSGMAQRLGFYVLAYLVPIGLQLSPGYLRFRLGRPSEEEIILRHLEEYMKQDGSETGAFAELPPELRAAVLLKFANEARRASERISTLEEDVRRRDGEIEGLRNSVSWRITAPLRWLHQRLFRR